MFIAISGLNPSTIQSHINNLRFTDYIPIIMKFQNTWYINAIDRVNVNIIMISGLYLRPSHGGRGKC